MRLTRTGSRALVPATALAIALALAPAGPAHAGDWRPDFEAPFLCAQDWSATTRPDHSPSVYSVDFNRDDDWRQPVRATASGRVSAVQNTGSSSYGKYIVVDHGNGWSSLYAHLEAQLVVVGQYVDQGTMIGLLGTSGGSTGPHLHFEQKQGGTVRHAMFHGKRLDYGTTINSFNCADVPISGDWNGDRRTDVGVARPAAKKIGFRLRTPSGKARVVKYGRTGDVPLTGDWDGDGETDVGVWRRMTQTFLLRMPGGATRELRFGKLRDVPVTGDWNGDGTTEVGTYSPAKRKFRLRGARGGVTAFRFGTVSAAPVTGDWDGDGRSDVGLVDVRNRTWTFRDDSGRLRRDTFGGRGGLPATGDWDGDGDTTAGAWGPSTAKFSLQGPKKVRKLTFGKARR